MEQSIRRKWFRGARKLFWSSAATALAFDQLTKWLLWHHPREGYPPVDIIPYLLRVVSHPGNRGGALGLPGSPLLYALAALVVLPFIGFLFATTPPDDGRAHFGLGLIAGGAVGNLIDRLSLGFVRDFVDLHLGEAFHWHTFNVADAAICIGVALVLWQFLFHPVAEEAGTEQEEA
ncbi:MAG: signal peptidase II [Planctomycetota bacterium]